MSEETPDRADYKAPAPDPDTEAFWSASTEGRLLVQRCTVCGHHQLYARAHCLACRSTVEWVEASGEGTVYSYTVVHQPFSRRFADVAPYVVALVDLAEGPRLMTNVVDCEPDEVEVGAAVRVSFHPVSEEASLPLFVLT